MTRSHTAKALFTVLALMAALLTGLASSPVGSSPAGDRPGSGHGRHGHDDMLPIVFVHGQSGSAQQFETQALRFTSNGYPQDLLHAFEYDTSQSTNPLGDLDAFVDEVLADTGAEQVYAIGHSRGTSVWTSYLFPDEGGIDGSAKVAKYVNIDGRSPAELPGGVPTVGIWGEWNTAGSGFNRRGDTDAQIGPDPDANFHFGDKSHTEVATSPEAFAVMYEFLVGRPPTTTDVVPERGRITVEGRAVNFPQNVGAEGTVIEVWPVLARTGQRVGRHPRATFPIDETGQFGPVHVNRNRHYEFALVRPDSANAHHFYVEPFVRSDHFLRLNTSPPGGPLDAITPDSDATTNLVVTRMREFWGDQGNDSDRLVVDGTDVVTPATSPRTGVNLAVFTFDDGLDGVTDVGKGELPPFNLLTFLTAVDVAVEASPDGSGTVAITEVPRGEDGAATTLNLGNWPSSTDAVSVQFRDFTSTGR